jgi:hypothetical protein
MIGKLEEQRTFDLLQCATQLPVELKADLRRWILYSTSRAAYHAFRPSRTIACGLGGYSRDYQATRPTVQQFEDVTIVLHAKNLKTLTKGSTREGMVTR